MAAALTQLDTIFHSAPITPDIASAFDRPLPPPRRNRRVQNFLQAGETRSVELPKELEEAEERRRLATVGTTPRDSSGTNRGIVIEFGKNGATETEIGSSTPEGDNQGGTALEEEEDDDEFWTRVSALRNTEYGIAMWCIAWNCAAMYVLGKREADKALFTLLLGLGHVFTGWQTKQISSRRTFGCLLPLLPPTLLFIQMALLVMRWNAAEIIASLKVDLYSVQFDGRLEAVFAIGNCLLMCFVCCCNLIVAKMVATKVGRCIDAIVQSQHRKCKGDEED